MLRQFIGRLFSTTRPIPQPSHVASFLGKIRRGCEAQAPKIGDWETLFRADGRSLEKLGIPVKTRRWILLWTEKFRQGVEPYYIKPSQKHKRPKKTTRKAFKHL